MSESNFGFICFNVSDCADSCSIKDMRFTSLLSLDAPSRNWRHFSSKLLCSEVSSS